MPNSKKRVKKANQEDIAPITRNIIKHKASKVVLLILASSFALSGLASLIYIIYQLAQQPN